MYSVGINLREGLKTTKKTIGVICPVDPGYIEFNNFWREFSGKKHKAYEKKLNEKGYKKKPRIHQKLPCPECFSYDVTSRKLPNQKRYQGTCNDCGDIWFQSHK